MGEWEDLWFKRHQRVGHAFKTNNQAGLELWHDDIRVEGDKFKEKADMWDKYGNLAAVSHLMDVEEKLEKIKKGLRTLLQYNYMNSCRTDVENLINDE